MTDQPIAKRDQAAALDLTDTRDIAKVMVASGFFKDVRSFSQAIVKVQAGRELGLGAFAAMEAFDIVEGKLRIGSGQLAAWVKAHPLRDYRVRESTATGCKIEWFQRDTVDSPWESIGTNEWTLEDAKRAGLAGRNNWVKYPAAMMFNRAMSNGVAMFVPDVVPTGNRVYGPGDDFGPRDEGYHERTGVEMEPAPPDEPEDEPLPSEFDEPAEEPASSPRVPKMSTKAQQTKIMTMCRERKISDDARHEDMKTRYDVDSVKLLTYEQAGDMIERLAVVPIPEPLTPPTLDDIPSTNDPE